MVLYRSYCGQADDLLQSTLLHKESKKPTLDSHFSMKSVACFATRSDLNFDLMLHAVLKESTQHSSFAL